VRKISGFPDSYQGIASAMPNAAYFEALHCVREILFGLYQWSELFETQPRRGEPA